MNMNNMNTNFNSIQATILQYSSYIFKAQLEIQQHLSNFNVTFTQFIHNLQNVYGINLTDQHILTYIIENQNIIDGVLSFIKKEQFPMFYDNLNDSQKVRENIGVLEKFNKKTLLINKHHKQVKSFNENASNVNANQGSYEAYENLSLKEKYLKALHSKDHKRHFQVFYIFKNKIKRMYRIDCMTRKINV